MTETFEEREKSLWPDTCPQCGYMAYIGMNSVQCIVVGSCRNFDQKESDRWVALKDELDPPMLKMPDIDEITTGSQVQQLMWPTQTPFDWHYHVETQPFVHDNGKGEWTYQLPAGEAKKCYIGDQHVSVVNGITYCICKIDRITDQITICWDKRVHNTP